LIGTGRCGCAGDDCNCEFESSGTVTVGGNGSAGDPITFTIPDPAIALNVVDTATVNLTKTGSGTFSSPFHISGTATPASATVSGFATDGTYLVPSTASMLLFRMYAPGGGGGGGQVSGTGGRGGGGGQGGAVTEFMIPADSVPSSLDIYPGMGGSSGGGATPGGGTGSNGTDGDPASVYDGATELFRADGGKGGLSGGNGGDGGDLPNMIGQVTGGRGADSETSGTQDQAQRLCMGPTGGGAGASHTGGGVPIAASDGGDVYCIGSLGGAAGSPGGVGGPWAGGGGGDVGENGGDGAPYGGGGGGGGGEVTGNSGGDGGAGADGYIEITAW
jgi:hypothetical protein